MANSEAGERIGGGWQADREGGRREQGEKDTRAATLSHRVRVKVRKGKKFRGKR